MAHPFMHRAKPLMAAPVSAFLLAAALACMPATAQELPQRTASPQQQQIDAIVIQSQQQHTQQQLQQMRVQRELDQQRLQMDMRLQQQQLQQRAEQQRLQQEMERMRR